MQHQKKQTIAWSIGKITESISTVSFKYSLMPIIITDNLITLPCAYNKILIESSGMVPSLITRQHRT